MLKHDTVRGRRGRGRKAKAGQAKVAQLKASTPEAVTPEAVTPEAVTPAANAAAVADANNAAVSGAKEAAADDTNSDSEKQEVETASKITIKKAVSTADNARISPEEIVQIFEVGAEEGQDALKTTAKAQDKGKKKKLMKVNRDRYDPTQVRP